MRSLPSCLLAAVLTALSPAQAAEPEAQLGWGLEFGGASTALQPTYRLGLAAGGLPLFQRTYRTSVAEADPVEQAASQPGGTSWVPWVVGGVVAIVAIGVNFADDKSDDCIGCTNPVPNGEDGVDTADVGNGNNVACVGNACVVCEDGSVASSCDSLVAGAMRGEAATDVEHQRWLDAGTGHMGDLLQGAKSR